MANKLRVSGQIHDKDRYISISETKRQMVAMLTDLQSEIEELCIDTPLSECEEDMNKGIELAADAIQQKINELKAESEG